VLVAIALVAAGGLTGCSSSSSPATTTSAAASTPSAPAATTSAPATSSAPAVQAPGPLSGHWTGSYTGDFKGTFTLTWVQASDKLTGTIDLSTSGTVPLTGTVSGSTITFGTVGSQAVQYTGTVSGDTMSGSYTVAGTGKGTWQAHRTG
jgi:hypothetical protein